MAAGLVYDLPEAMQGISQEQLGVDGDGDIVAQLEWDQVQAAFGDLLEPLDMYPPRYRVREFPGEERLREMGGTAD